MTYTQVTITAIRDNKIFYRNTHNREEAKGALAALIDQGCPLEITVQPVDSSPVATTVIH